MSPQPKETCERCRAPLDEDAKLAAAQIYGPLSLTSDRLLDALETAITRADGDPLFSSVPQRDEMAGEAAVCAWLDLRDFASLVRAFRHFGHFGECLP